MSEIFQYVLGTYFAPSLGALQGVTTLPIPESVVSNNGIKLGIKSLVLQVSV